MPPKVLIFTPIYKAKDYCLDEFVENAQKLTYSNYEHIFVDNSDTKQYYYELKQRLEPKGYKVFHVNRGNNSREALARAQNFARRYMLEGDYKYFFSLESDIFPPENAIEELMKYVVPVVTGSYLIGTKKFKLPCITIAEFNEELGAWGSRLLKRDELPQYTDKGLVRVQAGGMGCALIHRRVISKFKFTYDPRFQGHSDIYFFNACFNNKIPVFVNTSLHCRHENSDWSKVEDR